MFNMLGNNLWCVWLAGSHHLFLHLHGHMHRYSVYTVSSKTTHTNSVAIYPYTHVCAHACAFAFKIIFFKILEETVF